MAAGMIGILIFQSASSSPPSIGDVLRRDWGSQPTEVAGGIGQPAPPGHPDRDHVAAPPVENGAVTMDDGLLPDGVSVFDDAYAGVANLTPNLLWALRQAATDAAHDGIEFYVTSGWRSPAYQDQLLQEAVAEYGSEEEAARWVATADTSAHVSGDAVDLGGPDATSWLLEHGAGYGLCQIYENEPWHFELRPSAITLGCPPMYRDPTQDPRMQG
jgi:hypothetical protein